MVYTMFCECGGVVPISLRKQKKCQKCLDKEKLEKEKEVVNK